MAALLDAIAAHPFAFASLAFASLVHCVVAGVFAENIAIHWSARRR
jgi:hypothetical protein